MAISADVIYENYLKKAYSVKDEQTLLVITDTSCYQLNEETAWLIAGLPASGGQESFFISLYGLGIKAPQKIFDRLVSIGVLQKRPKHSWKDTLGSILTPKIKFLSAQTQENLFRFVGGSKGSRLNKIIKVLAGISILGLSWGAVLFFVGPGTAIPVPLSVKADGLSVVLLVILASLIHELGHSFTAMASGIGLRPIGFSVYLIYPAFYTNVSGIDKVGLGKRTLIDCGGFIFQGVFLFLLLLSCVFTGSFTSVEAARWIVVIILFNLNPLFKTDGYWLYQDVYSEFKMKRWARGAHYLYLAAFMLFSVYFLWIVSGWFGNVLHGLNTLAHSPSYLFSGGYRIVLGVYFILIGLTGGLRRFQEGRLEWMELRGTTSLQPQDRPTSD